MLQRRETKHTSVHNIASELSTLYNVKIKCPTILTELSVGNLKRFKANSIHLNCLLQVKGGSKKSHQTTYNQATYGAHLFISTKKVDIGVQKWYG